MKKAEKGDLWGSMFLYVISFGILILLATFLFKASLFTPEKYLSNKCVIYKGFSCTNIIIVNDTISMTLRNQNPLDVNIAKISIDGCSNSYEDIGIGINEKTFTFQCQPMISTNITILYNTSSIMHATQGEIFHTQ